MRLGWLWLSLLVGCADRATIGALCPAGCELRLRDSICDCTPEPALTDAATAPLPDASVAEPAADSSLPDAAQSCTPATYLIERRRTDLVVVIDDGASLAPWWGAVAEGFGAFLDDAGSLGVGIGLLRFAESCDAQSYLPPLIPIEPLPANLSALKGAIPQGAATTNSTIPALTAAEEYARSWANEHPEARVSVLLISDASPGACDALSGNYDVEAPRIASAAHLSSPFIETHVVGIGSLMTPGNIARAGGTQLQQIPITPTGADVLAALQAVRGAAGSCALQLPSGVALDGMQLLFTAQDGQQRMLRVGPDSDACQQADLYMSDAELIACPALCDGLAGTAKIELSSACEASP
jgi:hypothetical protein